MELPQRAMPQVSLRFLFAMTAFSAIVFTVIKLAVNGHPWAQVTTLLIGLAIATLLTYALAFTIGMGFYDRFGNRSEDASNASGSPGGGGKVAKNIILVFATFFASECVTHKASADPVDFNGIFNWPKRLEYVVLVGREAMPGSGGYHTIHIKVVPTSKAYTREHKLTFSISTHHDYQRTLAATTTSKLTLPQSGGEIHHRVSIPNFCSEKYLRLVIAEDGRPILDEPWEINSPFSQYASKDVTIGIFDPKSLGVATPFPDVRSLVTVFGEGRGSLAPLAENASELRLSDADARATASGMQPALVQFRVLETQPSPASWLCLSDLDVIAASKEFWTHSSINQSSRDAVRRWVAAGGVLWSYGDATSASSQQDRFHGSLQFESVAISSVPTGTTLKNSLQLNEINDTSAFVVLTNGSVYRRSQLSSITNRKRQEVMDALTAANNPIAKIETQQDVASRIRVAKYGLGRIIAIDTSDPFPESLQFWRAVQTVSLGNSVWTAWGDRFGLSYQGGSSNYWRWLIGEVGGPPVKSFLVLNTLFVLLVGPAACIVLRRSSKLYLLYFLAPAMALLVSGSLFAYAICSDGFGTQVRSCQWTWLDSVNDVVVHQDRSTYYSALGSGELRFPADSLVAVSAPTGNVNSRMRVGPGAYPGGRVNWEGDYQAWSDDFLPSRSQVQYLTTQPFVDTASALTFDESTSGAVLVTNRFTDAMGPLVYRSRLGTYFRIDKIDAGDTQPMQLSNQQAVQQLVSDQVLPPLGFVPDLSNVRYYGYSPSDKYPELEYRLNDWRGQMPKGAFVGLKEVDSNRIAIEDAELSASLQIVMGKAQ